MADNEGDGEGRVIVKYREALRGRVGDAKFHSWFADLSLEAVDGDCVTLSTGSKVKKDMIDSRYRTLLEETWRLEIGPLARMNLTVQKKLSEHAAKVNAQEGVRAALYTPLDSAKAQKGKAETFFKDFSFDAFSAAIEDGKDFDSFAIDESNHFAWKAAQNVFSDRGGREPIYVYGPSGVGKTHLLHAIAHKWRSSGGRGPSAYIPYSNLISGCVSAVWSNNVQAMHQAFLDHDLLEFDDIHLLDTKSRTQEELLNIIDGAIARGKQIVIAGELPPAQLHEAGIRQRLADRLAGGICVPVLPAGEALRLDVMKKRIEQRAPRCVISDEALGFVARNFQNSMRETVGALNQILLMHESDDVTIALDDAKLLLKARLADRKRVSTMDDAIKAGAEAFGITVEEVTCRAQPQRLVRARHAIVYCAREVLHESFPRIGKALNRDHTTAMSSYQRAQALLERDKVFQEGVRRIREALEG